MTATSNRTREEKLALLDADFQTNYAGREYGSTFKAQGYITECNFGGSLVILSTTGESLLAWTDWAGDAVDEKLTECEITYGYNDADDENTATFTFKGSEISLNDVMNISNL